MIMESMNLKHFGDKVIIFSYLDALDGDEFMTCDHCGGSGVVAKPMESALGFVDCDRCNALGGFLRWPWSILERS